MERLFSWGPITLISIWLIERGLPTLNLFRMFDPLVGHIQKYFALFAQRKCRRHLLSRQVWGSGTFNVLIREGDKAAFVEIDGWAALSSRWTAYLQSPTRGLLHLLWPWPPLVARSSLAAPHDDLLRRTPSTLIQSFICLLLVTYLSVNVVAAYPSSGGHHLHLNLRVPDHRAARFHRRRNR